MHRRHVRLRHSPLDRPRLVSNDEKTISTFGLPPLFTPSILPYSYIRDQFKMTHHLNGKSRRRKRQRRPQWMAVVLLLPVVILLSIWVLLAHKVTSTPQVSSKTDSILPIPPVVEQGNHQKQQSESAHDGANRINLQRPRPMMAMNQPPKKG